MHGPRLQDRRHFTAWLLIGLAAALLGGALPWMLFYAYSAALLLGWLWLYLGLRGLRAQLIVQRRQLAMGEHLSLQVVVTYRGPLPLLPVWLENGKGTALPLLASPLSLVLTPRRPVTQALRPLAPHRGEYELGPLLLSSRDPLGLFSGGLRVYGPGTVLVTPRVHPLRHAGWLLGGTRQQEAARRAGTWGLADATETLGVRPMRGGDSPRDVHWKVSARQGRWFVREYARLAQPELWIAVRGGPASDEPALARFDLACEIAASVGHHALRAGYRVRFFGREVLVLRGAGDLARLGAALARLQPADETGWQAFRDAARRGTALRATAGRAAGKRGTARYTRPGQGPFGSGAPGHVSLVIRSCAPLAGAPGVPAWRAQPVTSPAQPGTWPAQRGAPLDPGAQRLLLVDIAAGGQRGAAAGGRSSLPPGPAPVAAGHLLHLAVHSFADFRQQLEETEGLLAQ